MMNNMLVTGGCGFIGSNFIRYILEDSDFSGRIINVDACTYAGNPENLMDMASKFPDRYFFEKENICNYGEIQKIFERLIEIFPLSVSKYKDNNLLLILNSDKNKIREMSDQINKINSKSKTKKSNATK